MIVTLYSTGCPKCKVLKSKLDAKGIEYHVVDNVDEMIKLGIQTVPYIMVNDVLMNFKEGLEWVNRMG